MSDIKKDLTKVRQQIDDIDNKIQELINKRATIVLEVAKIKKQSGKNVVFYRPEREAKILRRVMENNPGPLRDKDVAQIFRIIMSSGLALQHPINVAFLGPEGTFSHAAAVKNFGPSILTTPTETIKKVFSVVESKQADYGVVPIENSVGGVVNPTLDALLESSLKICGEIQLPIHQNLLVDPDDTTPIKRIYSHQQSLSQCHIWLDTHYPNVERVAVSSNSYAAKLAKKESGSAAIAGQLAAELYCLKKLAERIEDNPQNATRFLILGHQEVTPSGDDKTTLLLNSISNQPGMLARVTQPLAENNVNITLMEWRPYSKKLWNYVFFLDIEGHCEDKAVTKALKQISDKSVSIHILGSYPKAIL